MHTLECREVEMWRRRGTQAGPKSGGVFLRSRSEAVARETYGGILYVVMSVEAEGNAHESSRHRGARCIPSRSFLHMPPVGGWQMDKPFPRYQPLDEERLPLWLCGCWRPVS